MHSFVGWWLGLMLVTLTATVLGQEIPKATPEGHKSLLELVHACEVDGGLKVIGEGKDAKIQIDQSKLRSTLAAHRQQLTPAVRDTLVATLAQAIADPKRENDRPMILAVLDALGHETKEERTLGYTALFAGILNKEQFQLDDAILSYEKAARHFTTAKDLALQTICLNNIGVVLMAKGENGKAKAVFQQVLEMNQILYPSKSHPQGHPILANSLSNLGDVLIQQGESEKARDYLLQALGMLKNLYPNGHPYLAASLNNLGSIFHSQGQHDKAIAFYEQALDMHKKLYPEGHANVAQSYNNLGGALDSQGDYGKAMEFHKMALEMRQKLYPAERYRLGHPELAESFTNLGGVLRAQKEYGKAQAFYQHALNINQKLYSVERFPQGHPNLAISLSNLGLLFQDQEEFTKAAEWSEGALQALRTTHKPLILKDGPRIANSIRANPLSIRLLLNYAKALLGGLKSVSTADRVRACEQAYALAAAVQDRLRTDFLEREESRLQSGEETGDLIPVRVGLCGRLFVLENNSRDLHNAFTAIEEGRARVFLERLGQANATRLAGLSSELRKEEESLQQGLRQLNAQIRAIQDQPGNEADTKRRDLWQQRQKAEDAFSQFERQLASTNTQYAAFRYPKPCKLVDARRALADGEVALLFAVGRDWSYAVVVQARPADNDPTDGLAVVRLPGRRDLAEKIAALTQRERLEKLDGGRSLGAELYQLLLKPLEGHIGSKDLVIVPDGPLCLLPFELLVEGDADTGRYLIEKRGIRYAPSLTALHMVRLWEQGRKTKPDRPLFALGDPVFDKDDNRPKGQAKISVASRDALREVQLREGDNAPKFGRLAASGDEVRGLGKLLGAAGAVLTDDKATEAAVKAASKSGKLARCRYVHFATHGILGIDRNEPPALVLSLVGTTGSDDEYGRDDGFLRLPEVSALKLNADLVVLSACRSGQGRMHNSEGVSGMARVFLYAGSRGVVCSLWSVDDAATSTLMQIMYKNLSQDQETAVALRNAKLAMIRDDYPPLYWAPFIHLGH